MAGALYNEIDPQAAAWLRELIAQGLIAPGIVDERDIQDISPADLRGFDQVHLFAGIGGWSYALRRAGWPDDRPVWTASCPCQPFSSAGKGAGFDDERHLWPAVDWLVQQCAPECLLGEQVASKDAEPWLDLVQADLEGLGYAFGACAFPSAGIGAPHIRDRTYWVADSNGQRRDGQSARIWQPAQAGRITADRAEAAGRGEADFVADPHRQYERPAGDGARDRELGRGSEVVGVDLAGRARLEGQRGRYQAAVGQRQGSVRPVAQAGQPSGMAQSNSGEREQQPGDGRSSGILGAPYGEAGIVIGLGDHSAGAIRLAHNEHEQRSVGASYSDDARGWIEEPTETSGLRSNSRPGPTNGLWRDADWLYCRDGKWRPVEPGTFPLAHGAPSRVGRLRGYGNAINAEAAAAFIASYLEVRAAA